MDFLLSLVKNTLIRRFFKMNKLYCFLLLIPFSAVAFGNGSFHPDQHEQITNKSFIAVGNINGKSYFWDKDNLNSTWFQSLNSCHEAGLYMASIQNEQEQRFLENVGVNLNWNKYLNIAGTDLFDEGNWRWMRSGRLFNSGYTNWYPESPYPNGTMWNCLGLDPASGWLWVDIGCEDYRVMTLCEYP